jgi:hypothetical protein
MTLRAKRSKGQKLFIVRSFAPFLRSSRPQLIANIQGRYKADRGQA